MHLLNTELCYWKPASGYSVSDSPGSLRQRVGETSALQTEMAFWVRYQDSPVPQCTGASPGPRLTGNPHSTRWLLGQGTVVYGRRQWVTGCGLPRLVHHSRLQNRLLNEARWIHCHQLPPNWSCLGHGYRDDWTLSPRIHWGFLFANWFLGSRFSVMYLGIFCDG